LKVKLLLSIFAIFLILALVGCEITQPEDPNETIPPCLPEWARAEHEVYSYWRAIINRQYELAKWHCILDGIWHNKTDEWEEYINDNSEGEASVIILEPSFYEQTEIIGDIAVVYVRIYANKIAFPGSYVIEVDTFKYGIELIKETSPPGDWKLK